MNKQQIHLRYDGPAVQEHTVDVSVLAPSLLAFNELLRDLNKVANGDKTSVTLKVKADIQANCVTLQLVVEAANLWESVKDFFGGEDIQSLKTIFEWLGIAGTAGASVYTLWKLVAKRDKTTRVEQSPSNKGNVIIRYNDGLEVEVPSTLYKATENKQVILAVKRFTQPTTTNQGIDSVALYSEGADTHEVVIDTALGTDIAEVGLPTDTHEQLSGTQTLEGHITIYQPTLEEGSKKWRFRFNGKIQTFDISETDIPQMIMQRGKVVVGDTFKVRFAVTEKKTEKGYAFSYKVQEVLAFIPGQEQKELPLSTRNK